MQHIGQQGRNLIFYLSIATRESRWASTSHVFLIRTMLVLFLLKFPPHCQTGDQFSQFLGTCCSSLAGAERLLVLQTFLPIKKYHHRVNTCSKLKAVVSLRLLPKVSSRLRKPELKRSLMKMKGHSSSQFVKLHNNIFWEFCPHYPLPIKLTSQSVQNQEC